MMVPESATTVNVIIVPHPHVVKVIETYYVVGSRVPVRTLYSLYRDSVSIARIVKRYPQLGPAKVFDAIAFGIDNSHLF